MLARAVFENLGKYGGVRCLVLVDEHFQDGRIGKELRHHDSLAGLVGALLVNLFLAGHSEGDDDCAVILFDQVLRGDGQVLKTGHGLGDGDELLAVSGAVSEFRQRRAPHVVTSEHGVNDADSDWLGALFVFTHGEILGGLRECHYCLKFGLAV